MNKEENRIKIGKRISSLRASSGITTRQLAELSGVTYQNINKIELGKYSVGLDVLSRITDALGCQIEINPTPIER